MSNVEVIDHRRVRVTPSRPGAEDVLEYTEALIEIEGWRNYTAQPGDTAQFPRGPWTLHDAIGEANRRLFQPSADVGNGKEGVRTGGKGDETTRVAATRVLVESLPDKPDGSRYADEKEWENEQTDQQVILDQLRSARGAAV